MADHIKFEKSEDQYLFESVDVKPYNKTSGDQQNQSCDFEQPSTNLFNNNNIPKKISIRTLHNANINLNENKNLTKSFKNLEFNKDKCKINK